MESLETSMEEQIRDARRRWWIPEEFDGSLIFQGLCEKLSRQSSEVELRRERGSFHPEEIAQRFRQFHAMQELLNQRPGSLGARSDAEMRQKLIAEKLFLKREELALLGLDILDFLEVQALSRQPRLEALRLEKLDSDESLWEFAQTLGRTFDESLGIRDTASAKLSGIRQEMVALESQIRRELKRLIQAEDMAPLLQEEFFIELNGRHVLLVRTDRKSACRGIAHGTSNSGQTTYMEPQILVELNNRFEELRQEESTEITRILGELNQILKTLVEPLKQVLRQLVRLDVLRAKVLYAREYAGCEPTFSPEGRFEVHDFYHPLVKNCVANSILLKESQRIVVISGPNAGGKTVTMKSLALMWWLPSLGMPAPASSAVLPVIDRILWLMGDYQSLMDSMSSFAAHLGRWQKVLGSATANSLLVADEIMNATDPREGEVLACEMLRYLGNAGLRALISTHYNEVKNLALEQDLFVNASMIFDTRNLNPTFRFTVGTPGSSYGLELATKFGLPEEVLEGARKRLGSTHFELKDLLEEEKKQLVRVRNLREKAKKHVDIMKSLRQELESTLERFARDREKVLEKAYRRVMREDEGFRKSWDERFRELADSRKEEPDTVPVREKFRIDYEARARRQAKELKKLLPVEEARVGDTVLIEAYGKQANVLEIKGRGSRLKVQMDGVILEVNRNDVRLSGFTLQKGPRGGYMLEASDDFDEVDLRAMQKDEALYQLEIFLDQALLKHLRELRIIHGKGVIKQAVIEFLKRHPQTTGLELRALNDGLTALVWG